MPLPYYQNKQHIYNWRDINKDDYNIYQLRRYYKKKITCPIWRQIKYEFLDILKE